MIYICLTCHRKLFMDTIISSKCWYSSIEEIISVKGQGQSYEGYDITMWTIQNMFKYDLALIRPWIIAS